FKKTITNIRTEAKKLGKPVAILQDLCGPKIRLHSQPKEGLSVKQNDKLIIAHQPTKHVLAKKNLLICNKLDLSKYLKKGQIILIDDGKIQLEVTTISKKNKYVTFKSLSTYHIKPNKGINLPNVPINISSITSKDIKDLIFGTTFKPEYIALSFVKKASDIAKLKRILQKYKISSRIIAKIETHQALENIDDIIEAADGIMVARGDLGLQTPIEELPIVQKTIIQKTILLHKPVIVATQMLASMTNNPIPTRAETTDVANAVFDNTSAVMLSEESAVGNFPIKAVNTLSKICQTTEQHIYTPDNGFLALCPTSQLESLCASACQLAIDNHAKFIIVPTRTGQTARIIASHRPPTPIIAATNDDTIYHQLNLLWGVAPLLTKTTKPESLIPSTINKLIKSRQLKKNDKVIIVTSSNLHTHTADELLIKTI
ncbi:pyruvate kinase, partial [Patescibacteria group bacterium]|nr:pyruvate kinase [Patescibacteria group bacterium]